MRRALVVLVGWCVGCSGRGWYLEGYGGGADSDHALPYLDPREAVPDDERSIEYSLMYEDTYSSETEFYGPTSVALVYQGDPLSFRGWCVDISNSIGGGTAYRGELYSSYEPIPPGSALVHPENLDLANYLVTEHPVRSMFPRQDGTEFKVTNEDMQGALWTLISSDPEGWILDSRKSEIEALVAEALAKGEGFVPSAGQHATMIIVGRVNLDENGENDVQTFAIDVVVPGEWTPGDPGEPPR
jgi:hypothetical protein